MIDASAMISARTVAIAFIDIDFTVGALKAGITFARISANLEEGRKIVTKQLMSQETKCYTYTIIAGAMFAAGITFTFIDINLTVLSHNTGHTDTFIPGIIKVISTRQFSLYVAPSALRQLTH